MLTKVIVKAALNAELYEHLSYSHHEQSHKDNYRNGYSSKTIRTEDGEIDLDAQRDRDSSFEPQLVKINQKVICGFTAQEQIPSNNTYTPNIVLYDYQSGRAGQCAVDYLQGFTGYLQVDGYAGYEKTAATLAGCWRHARRKFIEAQTAQPKDKTGKADMALSMIQKLYRIEASLKDTGSDDRYQTRQEKTKPLLDRFAQWLAKANVPPKTTLGKAIQYCQHQWHKLTRYIDDGNLFIDNNRAERAVKPFVIGRKNGCSQLQLTVPKPVR